MTTYFASLGTTFFGSFDIFYSKTNKGCMNSIFLLLLTFPFHIYPSTTVQHPQYDRILGGISSKSVQFPWQAQIIISTKATGKINLCSGSLINERKVLTAAHCLSVKDILSVIVALGHDFTILLEEGRTVNGSLFKDVRTWVVHSCFDGITSQYQYDLGIIQLPESVKFSSTIWPINLPKNDDDMYEDVLATVVGWGTIGERQTTMTLMHGTLAVIDNDDCASSHQKKFGSIVVSGIGYWLNKHPGNYFICARGKEQAICGGDSGGSLAVEEDDEWVIIGISSFTSKLAKRCTNLKVPQNFVRVSKHLNWIQTVMRGDPQPKQQCVIISHAVRPSSFFIQVSMQKASVLLVCAIFQFEINKL